MRIGPARAWHTLLGCLPKGLMFAVARVLGECRWRPVVRLLIAGFRGLYRVELHDAAETDIRRYPNFNAFFARALRPGARPVNAEALLVSPCDGVVTSAGPVQAGSLVQAKGLDYRLDELLADANLAARFEGGRQLTIYLAPADYHRVHVPAPGRLVHLRHVPGWLLAVNPSSRNAMPRLYARNERLVAGFETPHGPVAVVMVAAIGVSGIRLTRSSGLTRSMPQARAPADAAATDATGALGDYAMAEELARFEMGSTVILLTGPDFREGWTLPVPDTRLLMGERLG